MNQVAIVSIVISTILVLILLPLGIIAYRNRRETIQNDEDIDEDETKINAYPTSTVPQTQTQKTLQEQLDTQLNRINQIEEFKNSKDFTEMWSNYRNKFEAKSKKFHSSLNNYHDQAKKTIGTQEKVEKLNSMMFTVNFIDQINVELQALKEKEEKKITEDAPKLSVILDNKNKELLKRKQMFLGTQRQIDTLFYPFTSGLAKLYYTETIRNIRSQMQMKKKLDPSTVNKITLIVDKLQKTESIIKKLTDQGNELLNTTIIPLNEMQTDLDSAIDAEKKETSKLEKEVEEMEKNKNEFQQRFKSYNDENRQKVKEYLNITKNQINQKTDLRIIELTIKMRDYSIKYHNQFDPFVNSFLKLLQNANDQIIEESDSIEQIEASLQPKESQN